MTKIVEHNIETGEVVEREMTADELAQMEKDQKDVQTQRDNEAAQATEKAALLERLGLTDDEFKTLIS